MNTTATRRQLPLQLSPPRLVPLASRWSRDDRRSFAAAAHLQKREEKQTGKHWRKQKKNREPSIFEEIFPEADLSKRQAPRAPKDATAKEAQKETKVRYVTSVNVDKSEWSEYNSFKPVEPKILTKKEMKEIKAAKKQEHQKKRWEIMTQIPDLLAQKPEEDVSKEGPSLFEELFKSKTKPVPDRAKDGAVQLEEERLVDHNGLQGWINTLQREDGSESETVRERPAMLILSNASPNLTESDFYRIGPQGQHLDGWSASIRKVVQAYDHGSLAPLDRYFILFDSYPAAASYQKEARRRHNLVSRAVESPASAIAPAEPDPQQVFTLAPPSKAPLNLHMYKLNRATEARLQNFSIQGLLSMTPDPPPRAGSQVIVSLEGGTLDQRSLSQWIRSDARARNLGWPVQHMRAYFPMSADRRRQLTEAEDSPENYEWDEDSAPAVMSPEQQRARDPTDETAKSGRFVLSFPDAHEARRFVRAWHRKEQTRSRGQSVTVNAYFVW
ncbi:hypothetical protein CMUS01_10950 [Colletotrichum musicola]|uniref:Uncharacterized protein n=1 Tax=Colletotrichum musicola TaxID=2175873 RepID=A0A8H6K140_9PEZI|nr:hypothetical protein CMUS01_10950 [Colletotrichum musicola]